MKELLLDFDGCIADTISIITKLYDEDFSAYSNFQYVHPCEVETWDFEELTCASADYINTYFNQPRFFRNMEYMDNAKEVIDNLREYFHITIVSSGYSPNLKLKEKWIGENMPYADFIPVNLKQYNDKSHINMSGCIFIDDSIHNLTTSNAFTKICFGDLYPWNAGWNGLRLYNWKDVERFLLKGVIP